VLEILQFGEIRTPVIVAPPPKIEDKSPGRKSPEKASAAEPITGGAAAPA
jgi:hypothetical protein